MTRPGIEPWSPGPLVNTLSTRNYSFTLFTFEYHLHLHPVHCWVFLDPNTHIIMLNAYNKIMRNNVGYVYSGCVRERERERESIRPIKLSQLTHWIDILDCCSLSLMIGNISFCDVNPFKVPSMENKDMGWTWAPRLISYRLTRSLADRLMFSPSSKD